MNSSLMSTYAPANLTFERGEGPYLFTDKGERYLDFISGIGVNALGHAHPRLVAALTEQGGKLWHTANLYHIPGQERLAGRLTGATFAERVFFTNSGAEAVECSIKTARKYQASSGHPERFRVVTFKGAFHGRTLGTIAAAGQEKHLEGFGPPAPGFDHIEVGDKAALKAAIGPQTAAILIEPVQGEGGIMPVEHAFLRHLREVADANDLMLIFDEVQCGVGRTGTLFAHEAAGIAPDIMAAAKGLGGGFPMGACLATEKAAAGMVVGTHGSTFGGNPLAMAVGNALLDVVLGDGFLEHVRHIAGYFSQQLAMIPQQFPTVVEEIRGIGLMRGLKCRLPNLEVLAAMRDRHLLAARAGDNVVRFLPPLIIEEQQVREAMEAIEGACAALAD